MSTRDHLGRFVPPWLARRSIERWSAKQLAVIDSIVGSVFDRIVIPGPVQSGKSLSGIHGFMEWIADRQRMLGGRRRVIVASHSANQLHAALIDPIGDWCADRGLHLHAHRGRWGIRTERSSPESTIIELLPVIGQRQGDEGRAKSYSVDGAIADECTEMPEAVLDAIEDRCSKPDAKLVMLTNPDGPEHWFRKKWILEAEGDPRVAVFSFSLHDNPILGPRYIDRLRRRYTGAMYDRMVEGIWAASHGLIWPHFADAVIPHPDEPPEGWTYSVGGDWGGASVTHLVLVAREPLRDVVVDEFRWDADERGQLPPNKLAKRAALWLGRRRPARVAIDPSAPGFITALQRQLPRVPVIGADNDHAGLDYVGDRLETGRLQISAECTETIGEGVMYRQEDGKPVKKDDHGCDALRYDQWTGAGLRGIDGVRVLQGAR